MFTRYRLEDSFNGIVLSRHRTVEAALKAKDKHLRAVKRANGENSFLEYRIVDQRWEKAVEIECNGIPFVTIEENE